MNKKERIKTIIAIFVIIVIIGGIIFSQSIKSSYCGDVNLEGELASEKGGTEEGTEDPPSPPPCEPDCSGKSCGGDGCDGSCGSCSPCKICSDGSCVPTGTLCGSICCPLGSSCCGNTCGCREPTVCINGVCCLSNCPELECGGSCGQTCGNSCPSGTYCTSGGTCADWSEPTDPGETGYNCFSECLLLGGESTYCGIYCFCSGILDIYVPGNPYCNCVANCPYYDNSCILDCQSLPN